MIQNKETGEKIMNQPTSSKGILRKATLWVAVTLGLSFVAAYQLIGSDNVGHYEQGTTLHESPGLLGTLSSVFSLSADVMAKRQDDSDDNAEYWNTYDEKEDYDNFWDDFFDDLDEDYQEYDSVTPTTVYPTSSSTVWEDSTPTTTTSSTALPKSPTITGSPTTEGVSKTATEKEEKSSTEETFTEESTALEDLSTTSALWLIDDNSPSTTGKLNSQESTETPHLEESTGTLNLQQSTEILNLQRSTESLNLQQSTETQNLQESTETPNLKQSTETPFADEGGPCYIRKTCDLTNEQMNLFGADITLEEVTDLIFDPETLNSLTSECTNGTWCLGKNNDKSIFEDVDQTFLELCPLSTCLQDIPDDCMNEVKTNYFY